MISALAALLFLANPAPADEAATLRATQECLRAIDFPRSYPGSAYALDGAQRVEMIPFGSELFFVAPNGNATVVSHPLSDRTGRPPEAIQRIRIPGVAPFFVAYERMDLTEAELRTQPLLVAQSFKSTKQPTEDPRSRAPRAGELQRLLNQQIRARIPRMKEAWDARPKEALTCSVDSCHVRSVWATDENISHYVQGLRKCREVPGDPFSGLLSRAEIALGVQGSASQVEGGTRAPGRAGERSASTTIEGNPSGAHPANSVSGAGTAPAR